MAKADVVKEVTKEGMSFGKIVLGTLPVAIGAGVFDFLGALAGGWVGKKITKGKEQEVVKIISYLTAADMFLEKIFRPRGLIS